ncbi:endonuclease domain-containing protein [Blastomonas sp.]|uniref:endonuclease domain-containing protein n=1 Tax=Blastomonas sp. TaxID=1909299 RepID=UPI0035935BD7
MLQGNPGVGDQARALRLDMSPPEVLLWQCLRRNAEGLRFRRQHPSGPYVADFYCHKARMVVEIDGMMHDCGDAPRRDALRDSWFASKGILVIRVPASDVLHDVPGMAEAIILSASNRITQTTAIPEQQSEAL